MHRSNKEIANIGVSRETELKMVRPPSESWEPVERCSLNLMHFPGATNWETSCAQPHDQALYPSTTSSTLPPQPPIHPHSLSPFQSPHTYKQDEGKLDHGSRCAVWLGLGRSPQDEAQEGFPIGAACEWRHVLQAGDTAN
jgi:hypothetical protein